MQSIAALLPLIPQANLVRQSCDGIMLYSFATPQATCVFQEVERSKTRSIFIAGGPHPSGRPEETLGFFDYIVLGEGIPVPCYDFSLSWFFDYIVLGEGEKTLPELIDALRNGKDISQVRGIAYKKNKKIIFTEKREAVALDNYPPFDPNVMHSSIEITRGCPFSCAYCQTPQLFGHGIRHRSIDVISRYAKFLGDVRFTSPNAFAYGSDGVHPRVEKVEALLSALQGRIFFGTFPSEVRPEFITDRLLELVSKHCSNTTINMGGQSGSQRMLSRIKRGHTVEDIIIGAEKCLLHGFTPVVDFIFGLPGETEEEQLETLRLIKWLTGKGAKTHSHYFLPLPGTPLQNQKPARLSKEVDKVMGELALNGKATGVWSGRRTVNGS